MTAFPKFDYVSSPSLMKLYRTIPCQHCGRDNGTVCGAHSNWAVHGHGKSIKASDQYCASLCSDCHVPILDQGSKLSHHERQLFWWAAFVKTINELVARGRWPARIPVPAHGPDDWPFETEPGQDQAPVDENLLLF